jgi:hypothetical protein
MQVSTFVIKEIPLVKKDKKLIQFAVRMTHVHNFKTHLGNVHIVMKTKQLP